MSKRIIILSLFMVLLTVAKAQEKLNYLEVDKQSYQLFLEEKWPELIQLSQEARTQGIDFFYLEVRTGIAWYNQGKYRNASQWFLKAYSTNQSYDWLQEYVYYSLVFSGRKFEATKYAAFFSEAMKKKIGFRPSGMIHLAFETGYSFNPDFEDLKTRDFSSEMNLGEDYGEAYLLKNYSFQSLDLSHHIAPNFTLNHNLTYFGVNREAIVDWGTQTSSPIRINQFNYYINSVWVIGKKLNISPALNLIFGNGDVYAGGFNNNNVKKFSLSKINYSDAVFSTSLWSDFGNFSPGLEFNAGNVKDSKFIQLSSWITIYPFSNTKLYFTPKVYFKSGEEGFGWNTLGITGGLSLGKVYITGQYLFGDMDNFIESNGYIVSNFSGKTDQKIVGSVFFPLGKKYLFSLRYIYQNVIEKYQVYTLGEKSNHLEYNYHLQTITAGILWKF